MKVRDGVTSNYEYFVKADTSKYEGEWIAIAQNRVVAHGDDAEKVYRNAVKKVKKTDEVSLAKVPKQQMLVLKF